MLVKLLRKIGIFVGIIVLVPILLLLVAMAFLPEDEMRSRLVERLAAETGADVTLGEASVRLLPRLGVTLAAGRIAGTGAALAERTGSPNEIVDYAIDLDELSLDVALGPLLKRRVEIAAVRLRGPSATLRRTRDEVLVDGYDLTVSNLIVPLEPLPATDGEQSGEPVPVGERIPEDLAFDFAGTVAGLTLQKALYEDIAFRGELDTRIVTVTEVTAVRAGGALAGAMEIDYDRDPWGELGFEATAAEVPAAALLEPWVPDLAARLDGELDVEVSGTCGLRDADQALTSLDLTGRINSGEGVLRARDWLADVAPYLGSRQDLRDIAFSALEHTFRVERGRYLVQHLALDGHETDWRGEGWVGLTGDIGLKLGVKLPPGFTPELGQWTFLADSLRDGDGRITLDLNLTGRAARPDVGLDLTRLQNALGDQGGEAVQKGLGGLLDKWKSR